MTGCIDFFRSKKVMRQFIRQKLAFLLIRLFYLQLFICEKNFGKGLRKKQELLPYGNFHSGDQQQYGQDVPGHTFHQWEKRPSNFVQKKWCQKWNLKN